MMQGALCEWHTGDLVGRSHICKQPDAAPGGSVAWHGSHTVTNTMTSPAMNRGKSKGELRGHRRCLNLCDLSWPVHRKYMLQPQRVLRPHSMLGQSPECCTCIAISLSTNNAVCSTLHLLVHIKMLLDQSRCTCAGAAATQRSGRSPGMLLPVAPHGVLQGRLLQDRRVGPWAARHLCKGVGYMQGLRKGKGQEKGFWAVSTGPTS